MGDDRPSADPSADEETAAKRKAAGYVGQVVGGRYRVDAIVALGGMGAVFRAEHVHMRKQVALKVLHPSTQNLPALVTRFERESIVGAHVQHPNVCQATDFGQLDDGSHYLVLEYVEGRTLHDVLRDGPIEPARAAEIALQIAAGLSAAHRLGIVHRDVKPANVMILDGPEVHVKIVDFGLAKLPPRRFHIDEKLTVTTAGTVFGTVAYMAPELARGMGAVDHRSDLYALGVMLYEMLAGKHPFEGKDSAALFRQHCKVPPPPIVERTPGIDVSPALEAVVRRLLEKDPEARYQSADAVMEALDEALPPRVVDDEAGAGREAPDRTDLAPPSDASPPPAPAASDSAPAARSGGGALRWAALAVVAALGAAGVAWSVSPRTRAPAGVDGASSAAPVPLRTEPDALRSAAPSAGPSASSAPAGAASAGAASASAAPAVQTSLSPEAVRLRAQMNEAATTRDAKRGAAALLALAAADPAAFRDRDIVAEAAGVAVTVALDPSVAGDVLALLSGPTLGEGGPDVLFRMASFYGGSRGAARAAELLARPEVLARASPALRVARELKRLPCKERAALYDRAAEDGDERALTVLIAMLAPACDDTPGECCAQRDVRLAAAVTRLRQRLRQ